MIEINTLNLVDILAVLISGLACLVVYYVFVNYLVPSRQIKLIKPIKGPASLPILGVALSFLRPSYEVPGLLLGWQKEFGNIFKFWMGGYGHVVLTGPKEVEKILSSSTHLEKSTDYQWLYKWLQRGLLTASRDPWRPRRKLLTPAFHFRILEDFIPIFNEQANVMVKILRKEKSGGESFDIFPYITRCSLDIILETTMGKRVYAQEGGTQDAAYVEAVGGYTMILMKRFLEPWYQFEPIWKLSGYEKLENKYLQILHGYTQKVIETRQKERTDFQEDSVKNGTLVDNMIGLHRRKAFLDLMLDIVDNRQMSLEDVRQEVDTFMFEGHDTTAANIAWSVLLLGLHPEHQLRVQEELDQVIGDKEKNITAGNVAELKYLECCIKESLRIYPSVPYFIRHLLEDLDMGNGIMLPKGINVWVGPLGVHRNEDIYPDPEEFRPERFFPENSSGRHPYAFIPFSAGPRNCIGQKFAMLEEKIVLAKLFLNFNVKAMAKDREDVRWTPDIILRPYDPIMVSISPR